MTSLDRPIPGRVLAIGAHPDDVEFGAGGTLAKWAAAGSEIKVLVLTDGSKGTWDADIDPAELVATRAREQTEAAVHLGASDVRFAGAVDGELRDDIELRRVVCDVIRTARPDVVLGHDPWRRHRIHPDHEVAGALLVAGVVAARDPHFFAGIGPEPYRPQSALLFESDDADHVESLSRVDVGRKTDALLAHRSQWRSTMGIDDPVLDLARFRERVERQARRQGSLLGRDLGESFRLVDGW